MHLRAATLAISLLLGGAAHAADPGDGTPIPRSAPGDKGKYFLLKQDWKGSIVTTIHKRVGVDSVGFTRTEVDCATMRYRELGYGEDGIGSIKPHANAGNWTDLVPGSSKSDLVRFVCK